MVLSNPAPERPYSQRVIGGTRLVSEEGRVSMD